jgi:ABC-type taurine transport system ATPase subunit
MPPVEYRQVSQQLVDDLVRTVIRGENAIVLGPYFGGKTYLLGRIRAALQAEGLKPIYLNLAPVPKV